MQTTMAGAVGGAPINLYLAQHVTIISRHCWPGTTGKIERLGLEDPGYGGYRAPMVTVLLDKPIEHPSMTLSDGTKLAACKIYRQTVPIEEVVPYDPRDAAVASLRDAVDVLEKLAPDSWQLKAAKDVLAGLGTMEKDHDRSC